MSPESNHLPMKDNLKSENGGEQFVATEHTKRRKTWGEKKFDFLNYAGFALVGNEVLGTTFTVMAEASSWYKETFVPLFTEKLPKFIENRTWKSLVPKYVTSERMPMLMVAIISGNFMVPFIKHYEDRKGEIVRRFDLKHYGKRGLSDHEITKAHKDMDDAPKQSWGSLWKGRVVTILSAIGVDALIGWEGAPTTKLYKNNATYQRYFANYDRFARETAEGTARFFKISGANTPTFVKWTKRGTELFTLSTLLTILFYVSSKIFAKKRDERIERQYERLHKENTPNLDASPESNAIDPALLDAATDKPRAQISTVSHEATLNHAPQLVQGI